MKELERMKQENADAWESIASLEKRRDALKAEAERKGQKLHEARMRLEETEKRLHREQEINEALRHQLDEAARERLELRAELAKCRERLCKCCEKLIDLGILED